MYMIVTISSYVCAWTIAPTKVRPRKLVVEQSARIHEVGMGLKARGLAYRDRMRTTKGLMPKTALATASTANFAGFIVYRAYRGFFVILPAVFSEVKQKLERRELWTLDVTDDINPDTGKLKARSAILMNIGATVYTLMFLVQTAVAAIVALLLKVWPNKSPPPPAL